MKVVRSPCEFPADLPSPVATLGNFDGVHRGHAHLIAQLHAAARQRAGTSVVITFRPHPIRVIRPEFAPPLICTYDEKLELLAALNVDICLELAFDRALSQKSAHQFANDILVDAMGVAHFVAGPDSRFGRGRQGDAAVLAAMGAFSVESVSPLTWAGAAVSSSRIRTSLAEAGDVAGVRELLGRPVRLTGPVVRGDQRGRTIGFPTAHLQVAQELIPKNGVYAARVFLDDGQTFDAVVNIGVRPTFGVLGRTIEAHVLDFTGDLYGRTVALDLVDRVRDEQKFDGIEALIAQIQADVVHGRELLAR